VSNGGPWGAPGKSLEGFGQQDLQEVLLGNLAYEYPSDGAACEGSVQELHPNAPKKRTLHDVALPAKRK
jgi:hypothetical protein